MASRPRSDSSWLWASMSQVMPVQWASGCTETSRLRLRLSLESACIPLHAAVTRHHEDTRVDRQPLHGHDTITIVHTMNVAVMVVVVVVVERAHLKSSTCSMSLSSATSLSTVRGLRPPASTSTASSVNRIRTHTRSLTHTLQLDHSAVSFCGLCGFASLAD
jgi:hypothetical protein